MTNATKTHTNIIDEETLAREFFDRTGRKIGARTLAKIRRPALEAPK